MALGERACRLSVSITVGVVLVIASPSSVVPSRSYLWDGDCGGVSLVGGPDRGGSGPGAAVDPRRQAGPHLLNGRLGGNL